MCSTRPVLSRDNNSTSILIGAHVQYTSRTVPWQQFYFHFDRHMYSTRPVLSRDNNSTSFARVSYREMDSSEYTIILVFIVYNFHRKTPCCVEVALFWKATNSTGLQLGGEGRKEVSVSVRGKKVRSNCTGRDGRWQGGNYCFPSLWNVLLCLVVY